MTAEERRFGIGVLATLALSACAGHSSIPNPFSEWKGNVHLESRPVQSRSIVERNGQPVALLVGEVADQRQDAPSRKVGDIRSTVMFVMATSLTLDQNVPAVISSALNNQLAADGFRTVSDPNAPHDIVVDSVAKNFQLDILDRDELNIDVAMTLRDARSGDVLWAGSVAEQSSRFAGVSGDTGESIVRYFNRGLNAWAVKASANVRDSLLRSYPQTMALVDRKGLPPPHPVGVTAVQEATPREAAKIPAATPSMAAPAIAVLPATPAGPPAITAPPAAPAAPVVASAMAAVSAPPAVAAVPAAAAAPPAAASVAASNAKGIFSVTTVPSKAKVYGDDVYYGTSPLKLELDPGVTVFHFKLDGYKTVTQRVSIRRGETTELEVKLEK
jgi:hypothetical protein